MNHSGVAFLLLSALVITGCTHTYQVGHATFDTSPEAMRSSVEGEDVTVMTRDSLRVNGRVMDVGPDSIRLQYGKTGSPVSLPLGNVATIETEGSPLGGVIGAIGGGALGVVIGVGTAPSTSDSDILGEAASVTAGGAVGGLIGVTVGAFLGAHATAAGKYVLPRRPMGSGATVDSLTTPVRPLNH